MRIIRSGKWTGLLSAAAWLLLLLPGLELVRVAVAITGAWFLEDHEQLGQRTIYADREGGGYRGAPVALGDFDGDGLVDLVLAPMSASSGPEGDRDSGGRVHLIRGNGRIEGVVRIGAPPAEATVLTLEGARDGDMTGTELEVRDLDGDGHDDLLVGAQNYDGGGRDNSGAVWILWGGPHVFASTRSIDLLDAPFEDPAAAGLPRLSRIDGAEPGERLGIWTSAGDFDGDGRADLAIGADQYSITGRNRVGRVWIIYDARELPDVLDLAAPGDVVARTIVGVDAADHFGSTIRAGDLDGDGIDELIISAALNRLSASYGGNSVHPAIPFGAGDGPENQRDGAGEVWILFSRAEGDRRLASNVDLRDPLPPALADRITVVWGRAGDTAGEELIIGDFDADGSNDLAIGALTGAGDAGIGLAGRAYVIYGQSTWAREIDLQDYPGSAPEGGHEVAIFVGTRPNHILGDTLAVADLDRDGYDDLAIGVPHASPGGEIEAGAVAVAFGGPERWPPFTGITVEGEPTPIRHRLIFGEKADDLMSYSMAALDIDGDGYGDLFPNAMRGEDATSPLGKDAASVYVVSGYHVAEVELELETVSPSVIAMGSSADVIVTGDGFTSVADVRASIGEIEAEVLSIDSRGSLRLRLPPIDAAGLFDLTVETRHAQATLVDAIEIVSEVLFTRGDVREDGRFDITDAIAILEYLFVGETLTCLDAADVDDNGSIELTDPIRLLGWLFLGNAPPAPPHPAAGADPTPDELGCAR